MKAQSMSIPVTVCFAGMSEPIQIMMRPGETVRQTLDRTLAERGVPPLVRTKAPSPAAPKRDAQLEEHKRQVAVLRAEHTRLAADAAALQQQIEHRQAAEQLEKERRRERGIASKIRIGRGLNVFKRKK